MKLTRVTLLASAAALAGVMLAAAPASAYVACNGNDCWHTEKHFTAPGARFDWHPDDWYFHQHWDADRHFHDLHDGRGYWKGGVWIGL